MLPNVEGFEGFEGFERFDRFDGFERCERCERFERWERCFGLLNHQWNIHPSRSSSARFSAAVSNASSRVAQCRE
jgi:hypothetical protein